jgi:phosphoserine aminotransferase
LITRKSNYFASGPAHLPDFVLNEASKALFNFKDTGLSIVEITHRSHDIETVVNESKNLLREILHIPQQFEILFMAGGASFAFANIPLNLTGRIGYAITGRWSKLAYNEALRVNPKHIQLCDTEAIGYSELPKVDELDLSQVDFFHYASNETVHGIQFKQAPEVPVPLICDMSSDITTTAIQWEKYGIVYAGCAKNLGISGMHVVIIKKDLLATTHTVPNIYSLRELAHSNCLYNTPPIFQIYTTYLMLQWLKANGGLPYFSQKSQQQAELLYSIIDANPKLYLTKVKPQYRSNINIVFDLPSPELVINFLAEAETHNLYGLKGHKIMGGIRASLYNSITLEQVGELANFLQHFAQKYS